MLNSYSVLADEQVVTTSEPVITSEAVIPKSDVTVVIEEVVNTTVEQGGSNTIALTTTSEPTTVSSTTTTIDDTTTVSTENKVEDSKVNSKPTTKVDGGNYVGTHNYGYVESLSGTNVESTESETTTSQTIASTEVAKQFDMILETTEEPSVGTLTPLGVTDETKPVGLLEYLHRLPNTSSKVMKFSVLSGTVVMSGLIIGLLYKFSRKIFG